MDQLNIVKKDGANYELYELNGALNAYTMGEFQDTLYEAVLQKNIVCLHIFIWHHPPYVL